MVKEKNFQKDFIAFLKMFHTGRETAIKSSELAYIFSIESETVQYLIHNLRLAGVPICGDFKGYFYASDDNDIRYTARWLMSMGARIQHTACAMLNGAKLDCGQTALLNSMWKAIETT